MAEEIFLKKYMTDKMLEKKLVPLHKMSYINLAFFSSHYIKIENKDINSVYSRCVGVKHINYFKCTQSTIQWLNNELFHEKISPKLGGHYYSHSTLIILNVRTLSEL